jgi:hypothetical protein
LCVALRAKDPGPYLVCPLLRQSALWEDETGSTSDFSLENHIIGKKSSRKSCLSKRLAKYLFFVVLKASRIGPGASVSNRSNLSFLCLAYTRICSEFCYSILCVLQFTFCLCFLHSMQAVCRGFRGFEDCMLSVSSIVEFEILQSRIVKYSVKVISTPRDTIR